MTSNLTQITKELIKFKSIDLPESIYELHKVINFVKNKLKKLPGLYFTNLIIKGKPALIVTFKLNHKNPKLFLNGHLDVVPANEKQFHPLIKGHKLFGRGAHDMKGGCAEMIKLIEYFAFQPVKPDVGFMFVTDEERHGNQSRWMFEHGYRPHLLITLEPTDLNIVMETKGMIWMEGIINGKPAHGSRPWLGLSAVEIFYEGLQKFYLCFPSLKKERWQTTFNIGEVKAGVGFNTIPSTLTFKLDIRYIANDKPREIITKVKKCFSKQHTQWKIDRCDLPHTKAKNMDMINKLKKVMEKNRLSTSFNRATFCTDARFFSAGGINCAVLGTRGADIHGANEWVEKKS